MSLFEKNEKNLTYGSIIYHDRSTYILLIGTHEYYTILWCKHKHSTERYSEMLQRVFMRVFINYTTRIYVANIVFSC